LRENSMRHIRPYQIFTLIENPQPERVAHVMLPFRRAAGGTSLLETFLIVAGIRIVGARRVFEFGTFLGGNTFNMALNTPDDANIFTLDLDEQYAARASQQLEDIPLTKLHLASKSSLDFAGSSVAGKVRPLTGDSTTFDFRPWKGSVDFSFIDGGHDLTTAKSDTENAFEMTVSEKPSCIMWHDYRNNDYPELTRYLEDIAKESEIFHIEDTMLCIWFNDPNSSILPRLRI
jgi:hypothetical protein